MFLAMPLTPTPALDIVDSKSFQRVFVICFDHIFSLTYEEIKVVVSFDLR